MIFFIADQLERDAMIEVWQIPYFYMTLSVTSEEHGRRVISILSMESKHSVTRDKMNLETNRHSQDKTSKEYDREFK